MNGQIIVALGLTAAVALGTQAPPPTEPPSWTLREERRLGNAPGSADDLKGISAVVDAPVFHVPFTAVMVGADRTAWLHETGSDRWVAHTADGRVAGQVSLPRGTRPLYADDRAMWVASDLPSAGIRTQVLVRYRIVKR